VAPAITIACYLFYDGNTHKGTTSQEMTYLSNLFNSET